MRPLYLIDDEIASVVDDETGEIIDVERFDALHMERKKKIEGVSMLYKDLKAREGILKDDMDRQKRKRDVLAKNIESVRSWVSSALCGEKMKTDRVSVYYITRDTVRILDEEQIPDEFKIHKKVLNIEALEKALDEGIVPDEFVQDTSELDMDAIETYVKEGGEIPGAVLDTTVTTVIR